MSDPTNEQEQAAVPAYGHERDTETGAAPLAQPPRPAPDGLVAVGRTGGSVTAGA